MSTIITATQDDFRAAPAWVKRLLDEWAPPDLYPLWDVQVQITLTENRGIDLYFDLLTPAGAVMACGEMPALLRHISKANIAVIARGSVLLPTEEGPVPWFLHPEGMQSDLGQFLLFPEEACWLLGVTPATVQYLATLLATLDAGLDSPRIDEAFTLASIVEMNPGIRDTWAGNYQQATTAVHLL